MKADFFIRHGLVKPGDLCFDVGVRGGKITKELLEIGAEVVCVDANPDHAARMRELFEYRVYIVSAAVMDEPGEGVLYSYKDSRFTMTPEVYGKQYGREPELFIDEQQIKATTLDEIASWFGEADFVKLDVEGGERRALQGMTFKPRAVVYEWGMGYIEEAYLCADLLGDDYEFSWVEGHHGELMAEWTSAWELNIDLPARDERGKYRWGNVVGRRLQR